MDGAHGGVRTAEGRAVAAGPAQASGGRKDADGLAGDGCRRRPAQLPYARELADTAHTSRREDVRLSGTVLRGAVEDYAHLLTQQFLPAAGDLGTTLQRYADDHGYAGPERR